MQKLDMTIRHVLLSIAVLFFAGLVPNFAQCADPATSDKSTKPSRPPASASTKVPPTSHPAQTAIPLRGTPDAPLIVTINQEPKSELERSQEAEEKSNKERFDFWLTASAVLTMIFTGVLAIYTIRLALETKRLRALGDLQSADTKRALEITARTADASIALERPIFIIEHISIPPALRVATVKFGNHGRTPANMAADCLITVLRESLPPAPVYHENCVMRVTEPRLVDPHNVYETRRESGPLPTQWDEALNGNSILWAYGYIEYIDFMQERRRTGFCLRFFPRPNYPKENRTEGVWVLDGPPAYTYDKRVNTD